MGNLAVTDQAVYATPSVSLKLNRGSILPETMTWILLIIFVATVIRSTFGFGESLIAVPLLTLMMPIEVAVPLSVLVSITVAGIIVAQDHQHVDFKSAKWLIAFALPGIPLGLLLLVYGSEHHVKLALGVLVIAYSLYSLVGRQRLRLATDSMMWLFVCGFLSGIFGGAYGLNGPPLVAYGNMRNWSAGRFRATLQAYFFPASILGMAGYWYKGLWTPTVTHYFLLVIPIVVLGVYTGRLLNRRLNSLSFFRYIYIGLIAVGLMLVVQS